MSSSSIIMCHYRGESDHQPLIDLFEACKQVDRVELSILIY